MTLLIPTPCSFNNWSRMIAWLTVLGNPSKINPWLHSGPLIASATIPATTSLPTSLPRIIVDVPDDEDDDDYSCDMQMRMGHIQSLSLLL